MAIKPAPLSDLKTLPVTLQSWLIELQRLIQSALIDHNDLQNIQGGSTLERYHLTQSQHATLSVATSGTYTPTLTNVANLDASTAYQCQYFRVGSVVTVSGKVDVDPTAAASTVTKLGISLPIASVFSAAQNCAGTAASPAVLYQAFAIVADTASTPKRAQMEWLSDTTTNQSMFFTFTYLII